VWKETDLPFKPSRCSGQRPGDADDFAAGVGIGGRTGHGKEKFHNLGTASRCAQCPRALGPAWVPMVKTWEGRGKDY